MGFLQGSYSILLWYCLSFFLCPLDLPPFIFCPSSFALLSFFLCPIVLLSLSSCPSLSFLLLLLFCPLVLLPLSLPTGFVQDSYRTQEKRTRGQRKKDKIAEEKGQNMKRRKDKRTQEEWQQISKEETVGTLWEPHRDPIEIVQDSYRKPIGSL